MLKAVIFDMDGVLIDTEPLHAKAAVTAMKKFGVTIGMDYSYSFIGSTTAHMLEAIIEEHHLSVSVDTLNIAYMETLRQLVKQEGYQPIPYVKELIQDLYKQGIRLAIASSSTPGEIEDVVKYLKIAKYFDKTISGIQVSNPKPAPDIFIKALKDLGVKASECIVIEDSMNGVLASEAAGIASIGFINKNSGNQDLSKAAVLIESFLNVDSLFLKTELRRANGEPITIATTRRLNIRELTVEDIESMYQIYQNEEVKKYIDDIEDYLDVEIEKHKAYIKNVYAFYGYGLWGIFSNYDDKLIGRCGIQNREINGKNEIELGYLLDVAHWGFGYAIECASAVLKFAFETLEIKRIVAVIDKLNTRSVKVAEHLGMTVEEEIVDRYRHCYLYSIENKEGILP